jgi:hypothetical protein
MNSMMAAASTCWSPHSRRPVPPAAPQRPQALAAGADDVLRDLVDQHDVAREAGDDDLVEAAQLVRYRFPDLLELHSRAGP